MPEIDGDHLASVIEECPLEFDVLVDVGVQWKEVAWVEFLHSSSLNYWKENNSAMSLYRSIGRNDPDFMPVFLKALAARAQATQAALAAAGEGKAWTFGRYYEASQKNFMAHREGATPWGQPGKAFFESSGYWPLFSAWGGHDPWGEQDTGSL